MRGIIQFPPGFPPGLPCLVKVHQSRKTNRAHVATQPSSERCLFHDWRDWGCQLLGSFFIWVKSSSTTDASYNPWHSVFWHDTRELTRFAWSLMCRDNPMTRWVLSPTQNTLSKFKMHGRQSEIKLFILIPLFSEGEKKERLTAVILTVSCTAHFDMRKC